MNKLFIVILALCLVTVNSAIVKRQAETASPNPMEDIQKKAQEIIKSAQDQLSQVFNPENIKKTFSEGVDSLNKLIESAKQGGAQQ